MLAPHLSPRSVWFRNSLRAGLALALSVLVAKVSDIGHAFWVVLATLSILRSNVVTTGATVVSALVGTFAGFVLATIGDHLLGPHPSLLWITLPIAVFLSGYAPYAISFGAGQAMFALLVVELFNLMVPDGWEVGAVRLEAVTVGARGRARRVADHVAEGRVGRAARRDRGARARRAARWSKRAFDALIGRAEPARSTPRATKRWRRGIAPTRRSPRTSASAARSVCRSIPWGWLVRLPIVMRGRRRRGDRDAALRVFVASRPATRRGCSTRR